MTCRRLWLILMALSLALNAIACGSDLTPLSATDVPAETISAAASPRPTVVAAPSTLAREELVVQGGIYGVGGRELFYVTNPDQIQSALDLVGRWMETVNDAQRPDSTITATELAARLEPLMDSIPSTILDEIAEQSDEFSRKRDFVCGDRDAFAAQIVKQRELSRDTLLPGEEQGVEIAGPFVLESADNLAWKMVKASDGTWYSTYVRFPATARSWFRNPVQQSETTGTVEFSAGLRFRDGEWRVAWASEPCGAIDPLGGLYLRVKGDSVAATSTPAIPVNTKEPPADGYVPANDSDAENVVARAQAVLDLLSLRDGPPADLDALESQLSTHMLPKAGEGLCALPELMATLRQDRADGTYIRMTQNGPYQWDPVDFVARALEPRFNGDVEQWELAFTDETVRWDGRLDRVSTTTGEVTQRGTTTSVAFTFDMRLIDGAWWVAAVTYCELSQFFLLE